MKVHLKQNRLNNKGQAAIEFIVVTVVVFFFLFFYLTLSLMLVTSEYVDYATFMAARTYKSGFSDESFQRRFAEEIFTAYVSKVPGLIQNPTLQFTKADVRDEQTSGVVSEFQLNMFYLPPLFLKRGPSPRITLSSEAFLGRDPSLNECRGFFNNFSQKNGLGIDGTNLVLEMDDNGC